MTAAQTSSATGGGRPHVGRSRRSRRAGERAAARGWRPHRDRVSDRRAAPCGVAAAGDGAGRLYAARTMSPPSCVPVSGGLLPDLSRHSQTTTARASTCSIRSTTRAASPRSNRRRAAKARRRMSTSAPRGPICRWRSRAPTGRSSPRSNNCASSSESIAATQAHLENARRRLEAGIVAPHDVFAIEAQESRQQLLAIQARGNRDVAEADLARLIGDAAGTHSAGVAPSHRRRR